MLFEFVENGEVTEIEVDDSLCSTSHIDLELIEEEEDEDKTERQEVSD